MTDCFPQTSSYSLRTTSTQDAFDPTTGNEMGYDDEGYPCLYGEEHEYRAPLSEEQLEMLNNMTLPFSIDDVLPWSGRQNNRRQNNKQTRIPFKRGMERPPTENGHGERTFPPLYEKKPRLSDSLLTNSTCSSLCSTVTGNDFLDESWDADNDTVVVQKKDLELMMNSLTNMEQSVNEMKSQLDKHMK